MKSEIIISPNKRKLWVLEDHWQHVKIVEQYELSDNAVMENTITLDKHEAKEVYNRLTLILKKWDEK